MSPHAGSPSAGSPTAWRWARLLGGAAILAAVAWRVGAEPFVAGVRRVDASVLLAALGITAVTTVASAWRWRLVAGGFGLPLSLRPAVAAYYRSQLLNSVLPGGVLGDVHRGVRHGRAAGDTGSALRAVVWERASGQVVQLLVAGVALALLPSALLPAPVRSWLPAALTVVVVLVVLVLMVTVGGVGRAGRPRRPVVLERQVLPGVVASSLVAVAGHALAFVVAVRAVGVDAPVTALLPLALLVLLAMAVPANVAGWGPREGAAAWAFAAAGLGADVGVAVAVVYGVMALVATLPGAGVLLAEWLADSRLDVSEVPRHG